MRLINHAKIVAPPTDPNADAVLFHLFCEPRAPFDEISIYKLSLKLVVLHIILGVYKRLIIFDTSYV